jgi:hypothetical protein
VSAFEITQTDSIAVTVAAAAGKPIPTGSIALTLGTWASTATELTAGSVHIVIPANAVAAGSQTLTASYTPDWSSMGLYTGARSTAALTIEKASPSMALTASTTSLSYGTQLKLTATLSSAAATPTGSVTFTSGSTVLGTVKLGASGITTLQTNMLAVGTASIAAKYSGDSNNAAASSKAVSITTGKSKPAIALAPTANPAQAGASVTFTATLSGAGAKPTGSVVFFNGATQLGSVALNANGVAAFATSSLTAGSDTITASYSGNGDYTAVSASVTEAITK